MYSNDEWDILLEDGDLHLVYDCYLAHEAAGIPVPIYVTAALDKAGYMVDLVVEDDGQPDEAKEWEDYDTDC